MGVLFWVFCILRALVGSQSSTAIVGVIVGFAVALSFIVGRGLRLPAMVVAVLVPIGLLAVAAIGLVYWEASTELLNEDVTANGRTQIWADAIKIIEHRPLIGYGYGAVWGLYTYSFFPELETLTWASHAHDGYLQVASQLGLPTLALAALFLIHTLARATAGFLRWSSSFALFTTSYGFMFLVLNISEARLLEQGLFEWLLFVALASALARAAAETGRRQAAERATLHGPRPAPATDAARLDRAPAGPLGSEAPGKVRSRRRSRQGGGRCWCGCAWSASATICRGRRRRSIWPTWAPM